MSAADIDGGPAFPVDTGDGSQGHQSGNSTWQFPGMTLRDYFAAHAPEPPVNWHGGDRKVADLIEWRWSYADAMLKARGVL